MNQMLTSFLQGLAGMGPVLTLGLLPAGYQAMCRKPERAVSYAIALGVQIPVLAVLGWLMDRYLIPSFLASLLRPLLLTALLLVLQISLSFLFKQSPLGGQIHFFNQGLIVLGVSLYLMGLKPFPGLAEVLAKALGWSLGLVISTAALSFLLKKIEEKELSLISGWPVFLIILSGFWLAAQGLLVLLP